MKARWVKTAVNRVLGGGVALGFLVLLTLVFSFLGTILCTLLAGMALGATKPSKWISIPVSLVFPAVIFGVLRAGKTDLAERQVVVVTSLCFGAFWLTYGVAAAVVAMEQKRPAATGKLPAAAAVSPRAGAASPGELNLAELQGRWLWQNGSSPGQGRRKELEITQAKLAFRAFDAKGRPMFTAAGEVSLAPSPLAQKLVIAVAQPTPAPAPAEEGLVWAGAGI